MIHEKMQETRNMPEYMKSIAYPRASQSVVEFIIKKKNTVAVVNTTIGMILNIRYFTLKHNSN
jgi:hypothetical protein